MTDEERNMKLAAFLKGQGPKIPKAPLDEERKLMSYVDPPPRWIHAGLSIAAIFLIAMFLFPFQSRVEKPIEPDLATFIHESYEGIYSEESANGSGRDVSEDWIALADYVP